MATTNQRTTMVQIPAGVLAHLCMAADSGAFNETQLWGFTRLALQPYWITTQANGATGNAAQANQREGVRQRPRQPSKANGSTQAPQGATARKGSQRERLISLLRSNTAGMTRGEIIEHCGVKGDKSGEMSISNALTALTKGNQFRREGGKYFLGTGATTTQEQREPALT